MTKFKIAWDDFHREPRCDPNPAYPNGQDIDCSSVGRPSCTAQLPYPAKRCGLYIVECETCGYRVAITTAGRPDDPRSVKIACQRPERVQ